MRILIPYSIVGIQSKARSDQQAEVCQHEKYLLLVGNAIDEVFHLVLEILYINRGKASKGIFYGKKLLE